MNTSLDESIKDLFFLKEKNLLTKKNSLDLWSSRAGNVKGLSIEEIKDTLINFRRNQFLINENPRFRINHLDKLIPYKKMVFQSLIQKYKLLDHDEKELIKNDLKFSNIGNPFFLEYEGVKFNKRWLHNIHYINLIKRYLSKEVLDNKSLIIDIGGGYGILGYMLKKINFKGTYILVEFPEQLIVSQYFLKSNLPEINISNLKSFYENKNKIDDKFVNNFDVFFCPCNEFDKLKLSKIDLVTNFFSFGEMSKENFNYYMKSDILDKSKYVFYINRFFSDNEYDNDLSILDYNLEKFKKIYFGMHGMENTYIKQIFRYFGKEEKTNSQFFEIIGKK